MLIKEFSVARVVENSKPMERHEKSIASRPRVVVTKSPAQSSEKNRLHRGWTPLEPGFMVIATILLLAAGIIPWWGFDVDTSVIPYKSSEGVEFGLWLGTKWSFFLFPGTIYRRSTVLPWWDFVESFPEYSAYAAVAIAISIFWAAAIGLTLYGLMFRWAPRPRMKGWPTIAQGIAFFALVTAITMAVFGFPAVAEFSSFFGSAERLVWGPKAGWYVTIAAALLLGSSTWVGWRTDQRLKGHCWKCFREVSEDVCAYCGASQ